MSAHKRTPEHVTSRTVLHLDLGEQAGYAIDYACPPGEGIDVLGLQWAVRVFGTATRDRWKCDAKLSPADFTGPFLTSLDEILDLMLGICALHPTHEQGLKQAGTLPCSWPSESAVLQLRF